jgi:diguanylate cyclase (GGDEF)-like protein/PAS domain S-box-containing protein
MKIYASMNIRNYMLYPVIFTMTLLILIVYFGLYQYWQEQQLFFTQSAERQVSESFKLTQANDARALEGFLGFIADDKAIQHAWLTQDRELLLAASLPLFTRLKTHHHARHLYFHQLDGHNFLRVHHKERYGDLITRSTLIKARNTKTFTSEIDSSPLSFTVLRAVIPWYINEELVGFVELAEDIGHLLYQIEKVNNIRLFIGLNKQTIDKQDKAPENTEKNQLFDTIELADFVFYQQLQSTIPPEISQFIEKKPYSSSITNNAEHNYLISSIPWQTDKLEGRLFFKMDIAEQAHRNNQLFWLSCLLLLLLSLISLGFYIWLSAAVERHLSLSFQKTKNKEQQLKHTQALLKQGNTAMAAIVSEQDKSLQNSEQRYLALFEQSADALLIIDGQQFVDCNQAALNMLGYEHKQEVFNIHPSKLSPQYQPDGQLSSEKADRMIALAFANGSHRFEWDHQRKNGQVFPVEVLLTAIPEGERQLLHVVWRDISERKEAEQEISHRAYYDSVTGLPNRQLMLDRLGQLFNEAKRHEHFHGVLFMDLDRFKTINDSLGHSVGDGVLVEVAKRISQCVRKDDTAARFGGDEFVILLRDLGKNEQEALTHAQLVAENIQNSLKMAMTVGGQLLHNTVSIGINIFPTTEKTAEDVLKNADAAMYDAKESGRNCISTYLTDMHEKVLKRLTLEKDLRQALKEGTLEVYYQPQVDSNAVIVAVEALVRWQHPDYGFVSPEDFIPIAEESGIIYELGDFVINRAVSDITQLEKKLSLQIGLSVNISPRELQQPEFLERILSVITRYKLRSGFLTLETTESVIIENFDAITTKLHTLKQLGLRISLDDFGTGYSSLSYLKRLPIDELKIDRSFLADIMKDPDDALLVNTIVGIAHQFTFSVVAEGVESSEQFELLKASSCELYQGYLFAKPLTLSALEPFLLNNRTA